MRALSGYREEAVAVTAVGLHVDSIRGVEGGPLVADNSYYTPLIR